MRPYHLTSLEVPLTAISLARHGRPHMQPLPVPVAECCCVAKRPLAPGVTLGKIGEDHYRGWITTAADARERRLLPMGLAERAVVTRPVGRGEYLTYDNSRPDDTLRIVELRRAQDALLTEAARLD